MKLDNDICYKIIQGKDPRFDGVFYVGVKSTGIYCRTICRVPAPKKENCTYYNSSAEAESAGFRPCLRCRPEMAPGYSEFKQGSELFVELIVFFEKQNYKTGVINEASERLGISTRHVTRIFNSEIGVSPKDYIMTKRLLRAKTLLMDTNLPMIEVSELSGFGSQSRFNAAIKKRYKLTPKSIRKAKVKPADYIITKLAYRPPYRFDIMLNFLKVRAIPHVEEVGDDGCYRRTIKLLENGKTYKGWIEVKAVESESSVIVKVSYTLEKVLLIVLKKVKTLFDLDAEPKQLPKELKDGVRLPGCVDSFEMATRAILGQQISVKAATTLSGRIAENLGMDVHTPFKGLDKVFPSTSEIASLESIEDRLGALGVIRTRSLTIFQLAKKIESGQVGFQGDIEISTLRERLLKIKGIGPWSAEYILMRGCSWPDAFPVTDLVIKQKLLPHLVDEEGVSFNELRERISKYKLNKKYEKFALDKVDKYRPFRSYVAIGIWNDLLDWSD